MNRGFKWSACNKAMKVIAASLIATATIWSHAWEADGLYEPVASNDVAVLFAFGQSNSVGRTTETDASQYTASVNDHVYIARSDNRLRSKDPISWSPYDPRNKDNILGRDARTLKFNVSSNASEKPLANTVLYIADWWSKNRVSLNLPDLYIVHLAIGGQSINCRSPACQGDLGYLSDQWSVAVTSANSFVNPLGAAAVPKASETDVSLFNSARSLISRTIYSLQKQNKRPRILGVDWNQWEGDSGTYTHAYAYAANLDKVIAGFNSAAFGSAAGTSTLPIWFHYPLRQSILSEDELNKITIIERTVVAKAKSNAMHSVVSIHTVPAGFRSSRNLYSSNTTYQNNKSLLALTWDAGMFSDTQHYKPYAMREMALKIKSDFFKKSADGKIRFGVIPPILSEADLIN